MRSISFSDLDQVGSDPINSVDPTGQNQWAAAAGFAFGYAAEGVCSLIFHGDHLERSIAFVTGTIGVHVANRQFVK